MPFPVCCPDNFSLCVNRVTYAHLDVEDAVDQEDGSSLLWGEEQEENMYNHAMFHQ